jgi:hypothetical protein
VNTKIRVVAPLRAGGLVVLGRHGDDVADRRVQRSGGRAEDLGRAADRLEPVVVGVLVGDQDEVGVDTLDRGVIELDPA